MTGQAEGVEVSRLTIVRTMTPEGRDIVQMQGLDDYPLIEVLGLLAMAHDTALHPREPK